ncbi:protein arginine N-methyltransferase 7 isoform X1 [Dioscorea cayenensis subsp. rotundata]|uniref:Protein arginine N-methyltransferase 7 n=2 Tax=Dioscorea cayennensis subsp. rotundata TaxID=55577 RepID=A0AB40C4E1_DIOCR|nr:protein arginine N-methyltransferase 7 isoform X1 [Dioscorea cayenensis subsp. rotundata]
MHSILFKPSLVPSPLLSRLCLPPLPVIFVSDLLRRTMASSARSFQLRLNPLTGDSEWVVIDEEEEEDLVQHEQSKSLLATTSYLDMLNDGCRNRAFRLAIEKTITGPCHVLDIGAGTGLLSMMAARAMGGQGEVSACESYLPMGKLMRRVLRANGMDKNVRVFHKRSDELRVGVELNSRADVLVSEILDSELLGEGLIPTLQQAHDMLLVDNPKLVPFRVTTYGQLVESDFLWKMSDLCNNEVSISDGVHLVPAGLEGILGIKPQQHAMHCDALLEEIRLLSEPFKVFEFDFWKRPDSHGEVVMRIPATVDGKVHAVVSWWVLQLDYEGSILYSTSPSWINSFNAEKPSSCISGQRDWYDHWRQCVWFIPRGGISVCKDEHVLLQAFHDDTSVSYSLKVDGQTNFNPYKAEDFNLMLLPERIATYGNKEWRMAVLTAVKSALHGRSSPLCVVADDSLFLTILTASLSKNSLVTSVFPGLQEKGALYVQTVADANGFSMDCVRFVCKRASHLLKDNINQRKIDLLLGEPFYYGSEGMLPWHNLRFWKERTSLDPILADDVFIMPGKGILKVCAMSLPDLWRSRRSLKYIEDFDHTIVNETLGACGDLPSLQEGPCLPYFIWQCGEAKELSEIYSVMEFNFYDPIQACSEGKKIVFSKHGVCHGFVLWIDWVIDEKNSAFISTGPVSRYWKQGVKLLSKPVTVTAVDDFAEIEASFDPSSGELTVRSSFLKL